MIAAKKYLADLTPGGLFLTESRHVAEITFKASSEDEWYKLVVDSNILQKKSEQTALRYARTIRRRLEPLGREFLEDVINAHEALYTQLLTLATIIHSPVLADFMSEVLGEAKRVYLPTIPADAWDRFIETRYRLIDDLEQLSEATIKKSGANVIRILVEAGYLDNNRTRSLQPVYILPEIKRWLISIGREDLEPIMECTL